MKSTWLAKIRSPSATSSGPTVHMTTMFVFPTSAMVLPPLRHRGRRGALFADLVRRPYCRATAECTTLAVFRTRHRRAHKVQHRLPTRSGRWPAQSWTANRTPATFSGAAPTRNPYFTPYHEEHLEREYRRPAAPRGAGPVGRPARCDRDEAGVRRGLPTCPRLPRRR